MTARTEFALLASRLLLASLFLLAGTAKFLDPGGSRKAFRGFGVPAILSTPLVVLLPLAELIVAAALVPVSFAWYGACGAAGLLVVFLIAVAVAMALGRKPDCHCFGQIHSSPVGKSTLIRNVVLLAMALWLVSRGGGRTGPDVSSWFATLNETQGKMAFVALCVVGFQFFRLLYGARAQAKAEEAPEPEPEEEEEEAPAPKPAPRPRPPAAAAPAAPAVRMPAKPAAPVPMGPLNIGLPTGTPAPDFELPSLTGEVHSLRSLLAAGNELLLIFTSPHCEACQVLSSNLGRWTRGMTRRPTIILVGKGSVQENRAKFKDYDPGAILLQREFEVAALYDCDTTPAGVLIGTDGLVRGELALGAPAIKKVLLLNSTITVPPVQS